MTFLENFMLRCEARGESPSHALESAGLSKSALTKWRKYPERTPAGTTVKKLADYLGCTFEDLLYSGPLDSRTKTAIQIQSAVDKLNEKQQKFLLHFIYFINDEMQDM